ncbi:hypothetical protein [Novipirellula artificiosorum]|uniref:Cytochrome C n=1 Tax=Novipirellula artificiosorum TaxID=2528016 RepID=A0A5C6DWN3_9BACT|nr:hypothetical protein [Novipirellula artificiosorum]TWU41823.1 hypothetical protein Poly41_01150 [Novipirellula artificiosorum]
MHRTPFLTTVCTLSCCLFLSTAVYLPVVADDPDPETEPKATIKEVMKKCFKGPLVKKVASGKATDEEKKQLHELLVEMAKNQPPKGSEDTWKLMTEALVKAGKAAVDGDQKAGDMLTKAANCKACHQEHKP